MSHSYTLRVYYEDTDMAGIVYYANYLKFIERARSEFVRALGVDQRRQRAEQGLVFAVRRIEADFLRPAKFDDILTVVTRVLSRSGARIVLQQEVMRAADRLFAAQVVLVCISDDGRAARLPPGLCAALDLLPRSSGQVARQLARIRRCVGFPLQTLIESGQ